MPKSDDPTDTNANSVGGQEKCSVLMFLNTSLFFEHQQCNWVDSCTQYPGQLVILCPAGLQISPRRDALGLTRKWALTNNNGM